MIAELRPEAVIESEFSNYRDAVLDCNVDGAGVRAVVRAGSAHDAALEDRKDGNGRIHGE